MTYERVTDMPTYRCPHCGGEHQADAIDVRKFASPVVVYIEGIVHCPATGARFSVDERIIMLAQRVAVETVYSTAEWAPAIRKALAYRLTDDQIVRAAFACQEPALLVSALPLIKWHVPQ